MDCHEAVPHETGESPGVIRRNKASRSVLAPMPTLTGDGLLRAECMLLLADLMGGVLHDLNNPLSVVLGQAAALKERLGEGPERAGADRIVRSADRLSRVTKTFGALAREGAPLPVLLSFNGVVEETLGLFAHPLAARGVILETELAAPSPSLYVDPRALRLLVASLVRLVLEVAGAQKGEARLRVETAPRPARGAILVVSCPGGALSPHEGPRLGEPSEGGGGPSLFLAAQLTSQLGGTMAVGVDGVTVELPMRPLSR